MSDSSSKVFVHAAEASDRWSDSSPNSSGAATWSIAAADSNNELIVPRMTLDHDDLSHDSIDNKHNNSSNTAAVNDIGHLCIMVCGDSGEFINIYIYKTLLFTSVCLSVVFVGYKYFE